MEQCKKTGALAFEQQQQKNQTYLLWRCEIGAEEVNKCGGSVIETGSWVCWLWELCKFGGDMMDCWEKQGDHINESLLWPSLLWDRIVKEVPLVLSLGTYSVILLEKCL